MSDFSALDLEIDLDITSELNVTFGVTIESGGGGGLNVLPLEFGIYEYTVVGE